MWAQAKVLQIEEKRLVQMKACLRKVSMSLETSWRRSRWRRKGAGADADVGESVKGASREDAGITADPLCACACPKLEKVGVEVVKVQAGLERRKRSGRGGGRGLGQWKVLEERMLESMQTLLPICAAGEDGGRCGESASGLAQGAPGEEEEQVPATSRKEKEERTNYALAVRGLVRIQLIK